ncbi:MAG: DUF2894 domain-containing protein [Minicystis sp.]
MSEPEVLLASLREAGAEVFDPPGFGFVASLLARAEGEGGGARDRIRERARQRIDLLRSALESARAVAERELAAIRDEGASVAPDLAEALARGEISSVRRAIRRARRELVRARQRVDVPWVGRLREEALARGAALPDEVARDLDRLAGDGGAVDRGAHGRAVAVGSAVSSALLSASAESVRATIAVARAADNVPDTAGPYNGQVLAARALAAMAELSPAYVRAVVAAVDDLAGMDARLAPEAPKPKAKPAKPAKRKRAAAGG